MILAVTANVVAAAPPVRAAAPNAPGTTLTTVSTDQYHLRDSDGISWQPLNREGGTALTLRLVPAADSHAVITANLDLWTANPGVNQDIGIFVGGRLAGWKESGGFSGTFSPNAAAVQVTVPLTGGASYPVELRWKANKDARGATIYAGAGPYPGGGLAFSPTRLTAFMADDAAGVIYSLATEKQYHLHGSDGVTWQPMTDDAGHQLQVAFNVTMSRPMAAFVTANVDLWTADAGVNQDISLGGRNWKESGGFAGTFSPNAAMVQELIGLSSGWNTFTLLWKANKNAPNSTIYAGAGPLPTGPVTFSPTRITVILYPLSITTYGIPWMSTQYHLKDSPGATFTPMTSDPAQYVHTWVEVQVPCTVVLTANADLWTSTAGYNQDLAIVEYKYNDTTLDPPLVLAWKESGGFAGTNSPNAAYVQAVVRVVPGITNFDLRWKTNRNAPGATIWAGAGPDPPNGGYLDYSPTSLYAQLTDC
jgi:hypothetical protein